MKTDIIDADGIFVPLDDHGGPELVANGHELFSNLAFRLDDRWTSRQAQPGPNSLELSGPGGVRYFFRGKGHGDPTIRVHDRYHHGGVTVAELHTRIQVRNFVRKLAKA